MRVIILILGLIMTWTLPSMAGVDPFMGSLSMTHVDYSSTGSLLPTPGTIRRTYNNQSNYEGLFGFGWCSNLEHRLEIKKGEVHFFYCGSGAITKFESNSDGSKYTTKGEAQLSKNGSKWVYRKPGKIRYVFNQRGQLLEAANSKGEQWKLLYNGTKLSQVKFGNQIWRVKQKNKRVSTIIFGPKDKLIYGYEGNTLTKVEIDNYVSLFKYQYSPELNLKSVLYSNGDQIVANYGKDDRIKLYKADDGCTYLFKYQSKTKVLTRTDWQELCPKQRPITYTATKKVISDFLPPAITYKKKGAKANIAQNLYNKKKRTLVEVGPGKRQIFKFSKDKYLVKYEDRLNKIKNEFKIKKRRIASVKTTEKGKTTIWKFKFYKNGKLKKAYSKKRSITFKYNRKGQFISAKEKSYELKIERVPSNGAPDTIIGSDLRTYVFSTSPNLPPGYKPISNSWDIFDLYKDYIQIMNLAEARTI